MLGSLGLSYESEWAEMEQERRVPLLSEPKHNVNGGPDRDDFLCDLSVILEALLIAEGPLTTIFWAGERIMGREKMREEKQCGEKGRCEREKRRERGSCF